MIDDKKQTISVRISSSDHNRIKEIAKRLHVRESDLFRYAVKSTITKLLPLYDHNFKGKDLIPLFIEMGQELTNYFELDAIKLDEIINANIENNQDKVDWEDLNLIAMSGIRENHLYIRLNYLNQELNDSAPQNSENESSSTQLKRYFYRKYMEEANNQRSGNRSNSDYGSDLGVKQRVLTGSF